MTQSERSRRCASIIVWGGITRQDYCRVSYTWVSRLIISTGSSISIVPVSTEVSGTVADVSCTKSEIWFVGRSPKGICNSFRYLVKSWENRPFPRGEPPFGLRTLLISPVPINPPSSRDPRLGSLSNSVLCNSSCRDVLVGGPSVPLRTDLSWLVPSPVFDECTSLPVDEIKLGHKTKYKSHKLVQHGTPKPPTVLHCTFNTMMKLSKIPL